MRGLKLSTILLTLVMATLWMGCGCQAEEQQLAGGFNDYGKLSRIYVLRASNGQEIRLPFDYSAVIRSAHGEQNVTRAPATQSWRRNEVDAGNNHNNITIIRTRLLDSEGAGGTSGALTVVVGILAF